MPAGQVRGLLDKGSKPLRAIWVAAFVNPRSLTRRSASPHPSAAAQLPPSPARGEGFLCALRCWHGKLAFWGQVRWSSWRYKTCAKMMLKEELKRRGITYAGLAEKLATIGVTENERNFNNKISGGGFTAAFLLQCLEAIGAKEILT